MLVIASRPACRTSATSCHRCRVRSAVAWASSSTRTTSAPEAIAAGASKSLKTVPRYPTVRGALARMAFSKVSRYCLAHAQSPVLAIPPPALARELRQGRLAWRFWHRSLTPEQILRDQPKPAT